MGNRDGRNGPAHMASSRNKGGNRSSRRGELRPRKEPLNDRYYYEESDGFEDVTSYSSSKKKREDQRELERQRNPKKGNAAKKAVIISLAVLLVLVGGGLWYVFGYLLKDLTVKPITKDPVKLGWETSSGVSSKTSDFEVVLDDSIKNIAMFGVDARGDSFEGLSDVIMILTVDNKHGKIKMTSVLRDSCASIDGYGYNKINAAYSLGGPELAINTLNRNFHLRIEDYVTVNFTRMAEIVDAVGGIEMDLTADEVREVNRNLYALSQEIEYGGYDDGAYILASDYFPDADGNEIIETDNYEDGRYHLNGNRAVAYGRIRHLDSDDVRATRQQNVLKALIEKVRGKSKLEYPEMIRKIMPMCETSLDFGDIMGMLPIMFTDFTIETMNIPGEVEAPEGAWLSSDNWVYLYDMEAAAKHISQFIYEKDSPYYGQEIIPGDPGVPTVDPNAGSYYDPSYESQPVVSSQSPSSEEPSSSVGSEDPSSSSWVEDPSSSSSWTEDPSSGGEWESSSTGGENGEPNVWEDPGTGEGSDPGFTGEEGTWTGEEGALTDGGTEGYSSETDVA